MDKMLALGLGICLAISGSNSPPESSPKLLAWQLPFEGPHALKRQYLQPSSDYSAGHRGVDFEVAYGDSILAPADGVVAFDSKLVDRGVVTLKHGSTLVSEFEPACGSLPVGTTVRKGQVIGSVCEPETTYRNHCQDALCLHFSLRLEGHYLSPLALIGGLNPSRLFSP